MCSLLSFLCFLVEVGEEVEKVFGSVFLSTISKELDGVLEFLASAVVIAFAGAASGGVVAVEHRSDFEQIVSHIEKIRIENLFRRLHGVPPIKSQRHTNCISNNNDFKRYKVEFGRTFFLTKTRDFPTLRNMIK